MKCMRSEVKLIVTRCWPLAAILYGPSLCGDFWTRITEFTSVYVWDRGRNIKPALSSSEYPIVIVHLCPRNVSDFWFHVAICSTIVCILVVTAWGSSYDWAVVSASMCNKHFTKRVTKSLYLITQDNGTPHSSWNVSWICYFIYV